MILNLFSPHFWLANFYQSCLLWSGKFINRNDNPAYSLQQALLVKIGLSEMRTKHFKSFATILNIYIYIYIYIYILSWHMMTIQQRMKINQVAIKWRFSSKYKYNENIISVQFAVNLQCKLTTKCWKVIWQIRVQLDNLYIK